MVSETGSNKIMDKSVPEKKKKKSIKKNNKNKTYKCQKCVWKLFSSPLLLYLFPPLSLEKELSMTAGDFILIWSKPDGQGFYEGESGQGRRGLVPSKR